MLIPYVLSLFSETLRESTPFHDTEMPQVVGIQFRGWQWIFHFTESMPAADNERKHVIKIRGIARVPWKVDKSNMCKKSVS